MAPRVQRKVLSSHVGEILRRLIVNVFLIASGLFPWISAASPSASQTICEILLLGNKLRESASKSFQKNVLDRSFTLDKINPNGLPRLLSRPEYMGFIADITKVKIKQAQTGSTISLNFEANAEHWTLQGPSLKPIIHWILADITPNNFRNIIDESGGLLHKRQVLDALEGRLQKEGIRYGVILSEFPEGGRSFVSYGYNRALAVELTFGLDVPCSETNSYIDEPRPTKYYDLWQVIEVVTEDGTYCRIPVAIFLPSYMPRAIGRI